MAGGMTTLDGEAAKMQRWVAVLVMLGAAVQAQAAGRKVETVAATGKADFKTVQEAVDAAPAGDVVIRIAPGEYRQKLHITAPNVELRGMGKEPADTVLVWDDSHTSANGTGASASVTASGDGFRVENLTITNDFEARHARTNEGSQAVALRVTADRAVFEKVRLIGYQDTLYADSKTCHEPGAVQANAVCHASRQYFHDCYIEGHVDFIFGDAKAVFDHCELHGLAFSNVMLTAQSKVFPNEDSGYYFLHCKVTAAPMPAGQIRSLILGRPWRAYATVFFVDTDFQAQIDAAGWNEWADKLKTATYGEYGSHGPGANLGSRWPGAKVVTASEAKEMTVEKLLGGVDGWKVGK